MAQFDELTGARLDPGPDPESKPGPPPEGQPIQFDEETGERLTPPEKKTDAATAVQPQQTERHIHRGQR